GGLDVEVLELLQVLQGRGALVGDLRGEQRQPFQRGQLRQRGEVGVGQGLVAQVQGRQVRQGRDVLEALPGELRRRYVLRLVAAGSDRLLRDEPFHLLLWRRRLQLFSSPT